jgi:hypothetical protein
MADAVTTQILEEGPRYAVIKFTNVSDGTGESAVLKVDVSTLSGFNGRLPTEVIIEKIIYSLEGMQVEILWDATTDVICWVLTPGAGNHICFEDALLKNNSGAGKTGDIRFTTLGASNGDAYSIILKMRKVY